MLLAFRRRAAAEEWAHIAVARIDRRRVIPMFRKFSGPAGNWAYSFSVKNLWRVTPDMDLDDLMGEARLVFWQCCKKYPQVKEDKHFFCLFRTSFTNRVHRFASARRTKVGTPASVLNEEDNILDLAGRRCAGQDNVELNDLLKFAPKPIRRLVRALIPAEGRYKAADEVPERRPFESQNTFLCRLAGVPADVDIIQMVKDFAAGEI